MSAKHNGLRLKVWRSSLGFLVLGLCLTMPSLAVSAPYLKIPACKSVMLTAADLNAGKEQSLEGTVGGEAMTLTIGRDTPNGVRVLAVFGSTGESLQLPEEMAGFEDEEFTSGGLEAGLCDVTGDGIPEVLIASGDDVSLASLVIYTYAPNGDPHWRYLGTLDGQSTFNLKNGHILVPVGSQGRYDEYTITKDGIFKRQ